MIYTRFESKVKIIGWDTMTAVARCEYEDGATRDIHVSALKADGGIEEITKAAQDCGSYFHNELEGE